MTNHAGVVVVAALLVGCGSDEPPPSCQQAMAHYYGAQCVFLNGETGQVIGHAESTASCQRIAAEIPARCQDEFDGWVICLANVAGATDAGCDCSAEFQALLVCGT